MPDVVDTLNTVELAAELTAAWLANPQNRASADEAPAFLMSMHAALTNLTKLPATEAIGASPLENTPATTVRKSLADPNHIISMIDGRPYKSLRRHLMTHGMTPEQYRARYNLKPDYPMVAPSYSEARRAMAKKIGLGRKPGQVPQKAAVDMPGAEGRKRKLKIATLKEG